MTKTKKMTVKQAADFLGCDPSHVRKLLHSGKITGRLRKVVDGMQCWEINPKSVRDYHPSPGGWPRGRPRPPKRKKPRGK